MSRFSKFLVGTPISISLIGSCSMCASATSAPSYKDSVRNVRETALKGIDVLVRFHGAKTQETREKAKKEFMVCAKGYKTACAEFAKVRQESPYNEENEKYMREVSIEIVETFNKKLPGWIEKESRKKDKISADKSEYAAEYKLIEECGLWF